MKRDLRFRKNVCEVCGNTEQLHNHHEGSYLRRNVITLCYSCHWKRHGWPIPFDAKPSGSNKKSGDKNDKAE
jgi:hypothetical protein